jgi:excisionase family DNA binding protein
MTRYISISAAAQQLGVSRQCVFAWVKKGRIASRRIAGHCVLLADSVDAFSLIPRRPGPMKKIKKTIGQ